eukprot:jgi/Botrbrau1/2215/Bobra.101_2s0044.1
MCDLSKGVHCGERPLCGCSPHLSWVVSGVSVRGAAVAAVRAPSATVCHLCYKGCDWSSLVSRVVVGKGQQRLSAFLPKCTKLQQFAKDESRFFFVRCFCAAKKASRTHLSPGLQKGSNSGTCAR